MMFWKIALAVLITVIAVCLGVVAALLVVVARIAKDIKNEGGAE